MTRFIRLAALIGVGISVIATSSSFAQTTASATGHGRIAFGKGGEVQVFSFSAQVRADGLETGEAQLNLSSKGIDTQMHVQIDCVNIKGKGQVATLSGYVTHSSDPAFINDSIVIQVIDNGEGVNDPPDTMSVLQLSAADSCISCRSALKLQHHAIDRGNIQVHLDDTISK